MTTILTNVDDGTAKIWKLHNDQLEESGVLRRHIGKVCAIDLNYDGSSALSVSENGSIKAWDTNTEEEIFTVRQRGASGFAVCTLPEKPEFLAAFVDNALKRMSLETGDDIATLHGHYGPINAIKVTKDESIAVTCSDDATLRVWDLESNQELLALPGHSADVLSISISPDTKNIISGSSDSTIRVWNLESGQLLRVLEGHTASVSAVEYSRDGNFIVSSDIRGVVIVWETTRWSALIQYSDSEDKKYHQRKIALNPIQELLATTDEKGTGIELIKLDYSSLLKIDPISKGSSISLKIQDQYVNAKVVLVGDSGVGKSGLSLVLVGKPFRATDSTHGRHVWTLNREKIKEEASFIEETRETLLWDLAGQPGYRVIHRQSLDEVAVALVLFDSRSETDPFSGVAYWARALDEARKRLPLRKFLVAARIDRSGPSVSKQRIQQLIEQFGFDGYFETSARRGDGIDDLRSAVMNEIPWQNLPRVTTPKIFAEMKEFIVSEKESGRIVQRRDSLLQQYRTKSQYSDPGTSKRKTASIFQICLSRIEAAGLIKSLTFGDLVILQPELIDGYTAWLAQAARAEPDGLGHIAETKAKKGEFPMDKDRPLLGSSDEDLLITATVEDVVGSGIALRQPTDDGDMLVFPSEIREDLPNYPGDYERSLMFHFEGPVQSIHATLSVRLFHATAFSHVNNKPKFYKNAAIFLSASNEICGYSTSYPDSYNQSHGLITVFFSTGTSRNTRLTFLRYIERHLEEMAYEQSVKRERFVVCSCGYEFPKESIDWVRKNGQTSVTCPLGHSNILDDLVEKVAAWDPIVEAIRTETEEAIERDERLIVLQERQQHESYHIFLCHNSADKAAVRNFASDLRSNGILPWLDEDAIRPGDRIIREIERALDSVSTFAFTVGPHWPDRRMQEQFRRFNSVNISRKEMTEKSKFEEKAPPSLWQEFEYHAFMMRYGDAFLERSGTTLRAIPVLLPGAPNKPVLPPFLRGIQWVDLRTGSDVAKSMRHLTSVILSTR